MVGFQLNLRCRWSYFRGPLHSRPYISFILAGRNDGYGGDMEARFACFLGHLHYQLGNGRGLYEIVVCDWNPPGPDLTMMSGFDWSSFETVRFIEVSPELHRELTDESGYPILDYWARNVAIRRAAGEFVCVLNQDIYLSDGVAQAIRKRMFDRHHFYRADRCDFRPDFGLPAADMLRHMIENSFTVHRRHLPTDAPCSIEIEPGIPVEEWGTSVPRATEIASTDGIFAQMQRDAASAAQPPLVGEPTYSNLNRALGLHTNASGDFIIAAKAAFEDCHGFPETNAFYMHTDSYGIIQLYLAGYEQCVFLNPSVIFHADHDRSGRAGRCEGMSFDEHDRHWGCMLTGQKERRFNHADWGLGGLELPETQLWYGREICVERGKKKRGV